MLKRIALSLLSLLAAVTLFAQSSAPGTEYLIGGGDLIEINVFQDPSLNTNARVGSDGRINMQLLGQVEVSGLTTNQAADKIRTLLEAKYINKADVSVVVKEFESKPVSVFGAVNHPGKIAYSGDMNLIGAISAAGGLATGNPKNIYILRTSSNGLRSQLVIEADRLMIDGDPDVNVPVAANDIINVLADKQVSVYLLGEVMHPGVVTFKESQNPTLLQALAAGGGLTDRASKKSVVIKRTENGKDSRIKVNLRRILGGDDRDYPLKDNDTIVIAESFF